MPFTKTTDFVPSCNFMDVISKVCIYAQHKNSQLNTLLFFITDSHLLTNIYPEDEVSDNCTLYRCLCCLRYHDKKRFR